MLKLTPPKFRRLRVYAFDPVYSRQVETSSFSEVLLEIAWESDPVNHHDLLQPGPIGDYLEVIDYDPASQCFYEPVDLNHPWLVAQDGYAPSESNPQFHQQMVYAVAMHTIRLFETALGRCLLWAPRQVNDDSSLATNVNARFVRRLRIYPHALREANAYYSPTKKAILFGYTPSFADAGTSSSGPGMVFTCLSHDVIAHEVSHAILDGMHQRFVEATNPDVLAFHEAFADIVAIFQHFSLPGVLDNVIAGTRGDLSQQNELGKLAFQLGQSIGNRGALRDAIGEIDPNTKEWTPKRPDPNQINDTFEPHHRGSILVAAIFATFLKIYRGRIRDLMRIATSGTGVLPDGEIHPDLVRRLASEARTSAQHLLQMCIRALDYCPPVDVTFGEYLRALITSDVVMVPDDTHGYRVALIESFQQWGIHPEGVRSLSVDSLAWSTPTPEQRKALRAFFEIDPSQGGGPLLKGLDSDWNLRTDREEVFQRMQSNKKLIHAYWSKYFSKKTNLKAIERLLGLELSAGALPTVHRKTKRDPPTIEVHSVRWASRQTPDGDFMTDCVIEITQKRRGYFSKAKQQQADRAKDGHRIPKQDFWFRGGCTLIVSAETGDFRYVIRKSVGNEQRLEQQRQFLAQQAGFGASAATYEAAGLELKDEPFAFLHRI